LGNGEAQENEERESEGAYRDATCCRNFGIDGGKEKRTADANKNRNRGCRNDGDDQNLAVADSAERAEQKCIHAFHESAVEARRGETARRRGRGGGTPGP